MDNRDLTSKHRQLSLIVFAPAMLASATTWAKTASTKPAAARTASPDIGAPTVKRDDIVVSSDRAATTSSIDRKVYVVGRDLQAATGSIADILHNLPSVEVDALGNISLRGDSNVQLLIDGKPSTSLSAANRGEVLQQLPADSIDRIEVITSPSAAFKSDGSAGLINIITKKSRQPGRSGIAKISAGIDGRFNLGATQAYRAGKLSLNGSFNLKRDVPYRPFTDVRTRFDPVGDEQIDSDQHGYVSARRLSEIGVVSVDYDLTKADRLSASATYNSRLGTSELHEFNIINGATSGVVADFDRIGRGHERETNSEATAKYRHSFAVGRELTLDLRRGETAVTQSRRFINTYRTPAGPVMSDQEAPHSDEIEYELTAEYARPLARGANLLLGYDLDRDAQSYNNRGDSIDLSTNVLTLNPGFTNSFAYTSTVHALYGTYEFHLGKKLTALTGLRFEATSVDINQITTAVDMRNDYYRLYPTLHLEYVRTEHQTLRFSYSHRIVRPDAEALNPYPKFQNPINLRAGNPNLRPQETDAFEASLAYAAHGLNLELTPYLRASTNVFTSVSRQISPIVLLTTQENLGKSTAGGVEFSGSGKFSPVLAYSVSGNLYYNRIDAANIGINGARTAVGVSAKANLDCNAGKNDLLQFSINYTGRRLIPQGYRLPAASGNFGYRHQLRPGLAAVFTVTDITNTLTDRVVLDTGTVHDLASLRRGPRGINLALAWTFGGNVKTPNTKIDYSE